MSDLSQAVFPSRLCFVSDAVIIKIQLIAVVPARVNAEGDRVHFALGIQLSNVLLQLSLGDNRTFPDVNGAVVSVRIIPRGVEIELHPSLDGSFKRQLVIREAVPLASRGEVHGSLCLTCKKMSEVFCFSM